jgi:hypothetical protein
MSEWANDVITKGLMALAVALLGVAVSSLQTMSAEIKDLSKSVYELSSRSQVLNVTIANLERRLDKLEQAKP